MEIAVRWVYQAVKDKHGITLEAGQKPALCFKGRKFMLCVTAGHPVRVLKRPVEDLDKCRMVIYEGGEYSIARAVEQFALLGERNGMTEKARQLLARATSMVDDFDETEYNDEEDMTMRIIGEKTAEEVTGELTQGDNAGDTTSSDTNTTTEENNTMATKAKTKRGKKDKPAGSPKAVKTKAPKKTAAPKGPKVKKDKKDYVPSPESKIGKAIAFMKVEIKEAGGMSKLDRGFLKTLFERTAKKTGVAVATAQTQYNRQIRSKAK